MSEDSNSSKEEVDLAAIEEKYLIAIDDLIFPRDARFWSMVQDIHALLARARQQDARIAELEAEVRGFKKDDRKTMKAVNSARKQNRHFIAEFKRLREEKEKAFTAGAKETKERALMAINMAGLIEAKFGGETRARVITEIYQLVQSMPIELEPDDR